MNKATWRSRVSHVDSRVPAAGLDNKPKRGAWLDDILLFTLFTCTTHTAIGKSQPRLGRRKLRL